MWISFAADARDAVTDPAAGGKIVLMMDATSWAYGGYDETFFFCLALVFGGLQALWAFAGFAITFSDVKLFAAEFA